MTDDLLRPPNRLPDWDVADLPEPQPFTWRQWTRFIGPGIVMMGIQIGGGEWLFGPEVTARYGGGLMWIATVAIVFRCSTTSNAGGTRSIAESQSSPGSSRTAPGRVSGSGSICFLSLRRSSPGCRRTARRWPLRSGWTGHPVSADRGTRHGAGLCVPACRRVAGARRRQNLQHAAGHDDA